MTDIMQYVLTFVGGGLVGTLLTFWFELGRDARKKRDEEGKARQNRKTHFLGFLSVWEAEIVANRRIANANNVLQGVADRFDAKRLELVREAELIAADYVGNFHEDFRTMLRNITDMTPGEIENEGGRQKLMNAISFLVSFVRNS